MLLFTIAIMFVVAPSKAMSLDRDVGMMFFMPENQINVDVVTSTIQATTFNCDRWLEYKTIKSTDLMMTCNPALVIYSATIDGIVQILIASITSGNKTNDRQIASKALANHQRGVNTRLDIGERIVYTNFQNI
jgi:hypothetical protein